MENIVWQTEKWRTLSVKHADGEYYIVWQTDIWNTLSGKHTAGGHYLAARQMVNIVWKTDGEHCLAAGQMEKTLRTDSQVCPQFLSKLYFLQV